MEFKDLQLIKNQDNGFFCGYASIFNTVDSYNDIILNGAFNNSIKYNNIKLCWQHNINNIIGEIKTMTENYAGTKKVERIIVLCLIGLVAIVVVAVISFVSLGRARRTNASYDELIASLNAEKNALEQNLDYMNTSAYLEEQARDQFGMIKEGETLYIYE